ncbi:MAG: hypothetical protein H7Z19_06000, partial [Chitinophagaceae bacterium]|nr:hypothetical protein [Rubrivivax sp.]
MTYTIFFLIGIPLWLIPVAYILRHETPLLSQKSLWATMTFAAPFLIFSIGAVGDVVVQQQFGAESPRVRAFGYFVVLLNTLAFLSPFILKAIFSSRYAHQRKGAEQQY